MAGLIVAISNNLASRRLINLVLFIAMPFLVLFVFALSPAQASQKLSLTPQEQAYVKEAKPIEVSYDAFWPPFEFYDEESDSVQGINYEILMLISGLTGLKFEFKHGLTYAEALEELSSGQTDMHLSYDTNPEKAQEFNAVLSDTFLSTPIAMIGRSYNITDDSVFAVSKMHPVILDFVKKTFPSHKIIELDDITAAYQAVEDGEADFTFENVYAARMAISEGDYPFLRIANLLPLDDKFSFVFSEDVDPRLISIFNKAITCIPQEDFSNILLSKITTPSYISQFVQFLSHISIELLIGIIILLLILSLVLFVYTRRQKSFQKELERKQAQVQNMLDAFPMPIYIADVDTYEVLYYNKASYDFFGCEGDIKSQPCYKAFRNSNGRCKVCAGNMALHLNAPYTWGYYAENLQKHLQIIDSCIAWDNREKARLSIITDITEILELQKEKIEKDLNTIITDHLPLGITFWSLEGKIVNCNQETLRIFKFDTKEDYMANFKNASPPYQPDGRDSMEAVAQNHRDVLRDGYTRFEWLHNDTEGNFIPTEIIIIHTKLGDEDIIISYVKDLREVKKAQELLKESELRNTIMLDSMPMGVNFWDSSNTLIYSNLESATLFGFETSEEFIKNFHKIHPKYQPCGKLSTDFVNEQIEIGYALGKARSETICLNVVTGEEIPVELYIVRTSYQGKDGLIVYFRDLREQKTMLKELADNEQELRHAKELAEQSAKTKGEFLANMSHEIRTPMNGILGLLHLLEQTSMTETQEDYVKKTVFSANNLMRIIDDILDFSKIEAGKLEMEKHPFVLKNICQDIKDLYGPASLEKGLSLKVESGEYDTLLLLGDSLRLRQVLFNLISNAIKFTDNGEVSLKIEGSLESENMLNCRFAVSDTGIGLSPFQVERLFSAFMQADSTVTRKYGGTGLGLAISKNIISMMNGKIWVESELGKGSTFFCTVTFSLAPKSLVDQQQIENERIREELSEPQEMKIGHLLLTEDNDLNQLVAQKILQAQGFTVDIANNGQEALDMLEKNSYDLVLMDIQMPIMDGYTATEKIRASGKFDNLPIIAMSAHAMKGDKELSLSHGMDDHVTKPIDAKSLYKTLNFWLSKGRSAN